MTESPAVTADMIRKRAEHNEMELYTLEEVSLHQQDIERYVHCQGSSLSLARVKMLKK